MRVSYAKEAVYTLLGLTKDGNKEYLSYFLPAGNEKSDVWKEIFVNLTSRGLKGVKMITSLDLSGLEKV